MTAQVGCFTDSANNLVVGIDEYPFVGSPPTGSIASYPQWLATAVTANASRGVVGGVYVGQALSNDPDSGTTVWSGLANMETQKASFLAAGVPNGIYGLFSYYDIISAPTSTDPTTVAQKRSDTMTVLRYTWN
jgi:hypothetical protein